MSNDEFPEVKILRVQPGDTLVVESTKRLSFEQRATLGSRVRNAFPNNRLLVLDKDITLEIVREDDPSRPDNRLILSKIGTFEARDVRQTPNGLQAQGYRALYPDGSKSEWFGAGLWPKDQIIETARLGA